MSMKTCNKCGRRTKPGWFGKLLDWLGVVPRHSQKMTVGNNSVGVQSRGDIHIVEDK